MDGPKLHKRTLVSELNGNSMLSKDRLAIIKFGMLHIKLKVRLSKAMIDWNVIVWYHLSVKQ